MTHTKEQLQKLWLANDESAPLVIECIDRDSKMSIGFCRMTLSQIMGKESHLVFMSKEDQVPTRCPFIIITTLPQERKDLQILSGFLKDKREKESAHDSRRSIAPLPSRFTFFSEYLSVSTLWCDKITDQVKVLKRKDNPLTFKALECREILRAIHRFVCVCVFMYVYVCVRVSTRVQICACMHANTKYVIFLTVHRAVIFFSRLWCGSPF